MIPPFKSFDEALKALPPFIGGIDLLGQHKTVADLAFRVQHEIDLATEGEPNEIQCRRQSDTAKRWSKCRAFLLRCKSTQEQEEAMAMRHARFSILRETPKTLYLRDDGPWDSHPTITNDAEWVVEQVAGRLGGRALLYYDSDNMLDELLVKDGKFAGFAPGPR